MPSDEMRERARKQFESWVCTIYDRKLQRKADGYLDPSIDYAWTAWTVSAREELRSAARAAAEELDPVTTSEYVADWLERRAEERE